MPAGIIERLRSFVRDGVVDRIRPLGFCRVTLEREQIYLNNPPPTVSSLASAAAPITPTSDSPIMG